MSFARRRLPHHHPEGKDLFVTFHLHGSLPASRYPPAGKPLSGQAFVWMDRCLDVARHGSMYLRQESIAELVVQSLRRGEHLGHYRLHAWVLMANHVHLLLTPLVSPSRLLKALKGYTARQSNRLLGRTGEPFWQAESYDHWVRNAEEWERIKAYIENNPVRAGLVSRAPEYRWSSATEAVTSEGAAPGVARSGDAAGLGACATNLSDPLRM